LFRKGVTNRRKRISRKQGIACRIILQRRKIIPQTAGAAPFFRQRALFAFIAGAAAANMSNIIAQLKAWTRFAR
jgi:hypothetical protein